MELIISRIQRVNESRVLTLESYAEIVKSAKRKATDVDESLLSSHDLYGEYLRTKLNLNVRFDEWITFYAGDVPKIRDAGISEDDFRGLLRQLGNDPRFSRVPAFAYAVDSIKLLSNTEDNSDWYTITSRSNHYYDDPLGITEKNFMHISLSIPRNNIILVGNNETKLQHMKRLGITTMVEDKLDTVIEFASNGIYVMLPFKPWNVASRKDNYLLPEVLSKKQHDLNALDDLRHMIVRVPSWQSLYKVLKSEFTPSGEAVHHLV